MTASSATAFAIRPLKDGFGAEILDLDVKKAGPEDLRAVVDCLDRHGAILIRGQSLSAPDQVAFTKAFGEPAENAPLEFTVPDVPEVFVISNKVVDGRKIGDSEAGTAWHTDMNYAERPAAYTILHALEVPEEGSDTLLADTCGAWNALTGEMQHRIDGMIVHHSYANLVARSKREMTEAERIAYPDVFHPLVRRHPADGRKTLWGLSTTTPNGIEGLPNPEGKNLIRDLMAFATREQFVYRHKWRAGDILAWDNRCTLHTGTPFDQSRYIRHVHRTWVRGEKPV